MRLIYALAISLALVVSTPGLATADTFNRPARNQQAINYVLTRALAQIGVAFTYGGGNSTGPTIGVARATDVPGTDPLAVPGGTQVAVPGGTQLAVPGGTQLALPGGTQLAVPGGIPQPQVIGFDASGLVQYAFAGVGIKMPRSSGEQYLASSKVPPAAALPGDLIFYGPDGAQSVAIFLGNGQMLEATDPAVTVSPVRTAGMTPYLGRVIA